MNKKLNIDNTIELSKVLYLYDAYSFITLAYSSFNKADSGKVEEFISLKPKVTKFLDIIERDMKRIHKAVFTYLYVVEKTNRGVLAVGIWNNLNISTGDEQTMLRYKKLWSSILTNGNSEELLDYFYCYRLPFVNKKEFTDYAFRRLVGRELNPLYLSTSKNLSFFVDPNNNPDDVY